MLTIHLKNTENGYASPVPAASLKKSVLFYVRKLTKRIPHLPLKPRKNAIIKLQPIIYIWEIMSM